MTDEKPPARRRVRARTDATPSPTQSTTSAAASPRPRRRRPAASRASELTQPGLGSFQDLYFGLAAAEREVALDPVRFRETYLDRHDLPARVATHERFLILGPKGTGKSAAALFVAESWKHTLGASAVFPQRVDFDELNRTQTPLASLDSKLVSADVSTMTDTAWKLFIGVRFLEALIGDAGSSLSHDSQAGRLLSELQAAGLASDDYPRVLRSVRDKKGGFDFKLLHGDVGSQETDSLSPGQVADALLRLIVTVRTPNRHLLIIDGLDKAITANESYWLTVGALIRVVDHVTRLAQESQANIFLMLLCRSDVFRRVRFADAPKIAADGGLHIGWLAEAADAKEVLLWDFLGRKAGLTKQEIWSYLPTSVRVGKQGGEETLRYLLNFTRYTPRDMSLLFRSLQESGGSGRLTGAQVRQGADHFASQHLLAEMIAEAVGLLPAKVVDRLESILGSAKKRVITKAQLKKMIADQGLADEIDEFQLGEYLFLQGAIGNYRPAEGYVQFFHRRDAAKYSAAGPWVLHTGLVYANNIPWSGT